MPTQRNRPEDAWRFVQRGAESECWPWTASVTSHGYGSYSIGHQSHRAHRIIFEIENGPIPPGLFVCHSCDNRRCCNPAHLFLGTPAENSRDAVIKGRSPKGERCARARLTAPEVLQIRRLLTAGHPQKEVGALFGVTQSAVSAINRGLTWTHV